MHFVYVIVSINRKYIYVGLTNNPERRISEHQNGWNKTTKPYAPFYVLLTEPYSDRLTARKREVYLKSGAGKEYLKSLLPGN
ncbi:MAG: GIY-YIG nuclease family protein [Ferruginibacter sp.]